MPVVLRALHTYPLKSGASLHHEACFYDGRGLANDRQWALCDSEGRLITARKYHQLLGMRCRADGNELLVNWNGEQARFSMQTDKQKELVHYSAEFQGVQISPEADRWFSERLDMNAHLVLNDPANQRWIKKKDVEGNHPIRMVDAAPILLCSQESLDAINEQVSPPIHMLQFRPNVVVSGADAWEEFSWSQVWIGSHRFKVIKPCIRCVLTTIDIESHTPRADGQPLRRLHHLQQSDATRFGVYLLPLGSGELSLGMNVDFR